jgi:transcriptional regulator with XRE-family HTH domain
MRLSDTYTDELVLEEIGRRLTRARLNRNWTQDGLARMAGLSKRTVERIEGGQSVQLSNFIRALKALQLTENLERLVPDVPASPMAKLRLHRQEPQRASHTRSAAAPSGRWTWADEK